MRTVFNHALGYGALPFIALVGLAYGWIVSRFVKTEPRQQTGAAERRAA